MATEVDPLLVVTPRDRCTACGREALKGCSRCRGTGREPATLAGLWAGRPAFLVGAGPSVNQFPYRRLAERGVASIGINNAAAYVPVSAWCFGDHQRKFHHGLFFDPAMITFVPDGKLGRVVRARVDGRFRSTGIKVGDCPNVWGFSRSCRFEPERFFATPWAHWGTKSGGRTLDTMLLGLRLLHYLGVRRVYLLGVDLWREGKEDGYCFNHPSSGGVQKYVKTNRMLHELVPTFDRHGFEVLNTNPESRCDAFPFADFEAAIINCKGAVPGEPFDLAEWYSQGAVKRDAAAFPGPIPWPELCERHSGLV